MGGHTVSFVSGGREEEKEGGMEDINVVIIRPFFIVTLAASSVRRTGVRGKGLWDLLYVGILKRREHSIAKRMAWEEGSKFDNCIRNHLEKNDHEKFPLAPRGASRGNLATMIVGVISPTFRGGLLLFQPRFTYNLIAGFCPACQFGHRN